MSGQPHPLPSGTIRAATGALTAVYCMSFYITFDWWSLPVTLFAGSVLGLLGWSAAWDAVWQRLPAAVQHYAAWAHDGLVAGEIPYCSFKHL